MPLFVCISCAGYTLRVIGHLSRSNVMLRSGASIGLPLNYLFFLHAVSLFCSCRAARHERAATKMTAAYGRRRERGRLADEDPEFFLASFSADICIFQEWTVGKRAQAPGSLKSLGV